MKSKLYSSKAVSVEGIKISAYYNILQPSTNCAYKVEQNDLSFGNVVGVDGCERTTLRFKK